MNAQELTDAISEHVEERIAKFLTPEQWRNVAVSLNDSVEIVFSPIIAVKGARWHNVDIHLELPSGDLLVIDPYSECVEYLQITEKGVAEKIVTMLAQVAAPYEPPPKPKTVTELLQEENAALKARIAELEGKQ